MNAAESLLRTAAAAGVEVCFANPGTSEMALVAALDRVDGLRAVLALFEGVCTGAADGWGRMTGRPALTLLHHGPGFANGIANLHNARRARSPVVNLVGDHPDRHLIWDAPLTSDLESLARPVSDWLRRSASAGELAKDVAAAVAAAAREPGAVATLVVPSDLARADAAGPAAPVPPGRATAVPGARIDAVARRLRDGGPAVLLLGAHGLRERALRAAARVAAATGCRLLTETFPARHERGGDLPRVGRLPYFPEMALGALAGVATLLRASAPEPASFFLYPGLPSRLVPEGCESVLLAEPREDVAGALEALADALRAPAAPTGGAIGAGGTSRPERPTGRLDPARLGAALAAAQPEGAIVVDEAATSGGAWFEAAAAGPRHTVLALTGGAIGQGLPVATGAALACPDRPVIAFQADGSGLYTVQSLWTQARENLHVVNVICANRSYRILRVELARAGIAEPGPKALSLTDLARPPIDWISLARGFGVPGERVEQAEDLTRTLERALAEPGPHLIEAVL
jgi:acetolactate synthase-1/2/3 large subunit